MVVSDPGFVAFRQEVVVAAGQSVPVKIVLSYTVEDFAPVTDRWRPPSPVWQRYPPEQEGEYPSVPNRGLDPYDQSVLKGAIPIIGDNIFMILTGVAEMPFEYRKVPTPSGVSQEDGGRTSSSERVSSSRSLPTGVFSFEMFPRQHRLQAARMGVPRHAGLQPELRQHEREERPPHHAGGGQESQGVMTSPCRRRSAN